MIYSGRSARVAAIVDSDNKTTKLQRIPLMEKSFNEKCVWDNSIRTYSDLSKIAFNVDDTMLSS